MPLDRKKEVLDYLKDTGLEVSDKIFDRSLVTVKENDNEFEKLVEILEKFLDDKNVHKLAVLPRLRDIIFGVGNNIYYRSLLMASQCKGDNVDDFVTAFFYWYDVFGSAVGGARSMQFSDIAQAIINFRSAEHMTEVRAGGMEEYEQKSGGLKNVFK